MPTTDSANSLWTHVRRDTRRGKVPSERELRREAVRTRGQNGPMGFSVAAPDNPFFALLSQPMASARRLTSFPLLFLSRLPLLLSHRLEPKRRPTDWLPARRYAHGPSSGALTAVRIMQTPNRKRDSPAAPGVVAAAAHSLHGSSFVPRHWPPFRSYRRLAAHHLQQRPGDCH